MLHFFPDEGGTEAAEGKTTATTTEPTEGKGGAEAAQAATAEGKPRETDWERADRQARHWANAKPEDRERFVRLIEDQQKGESPETRELRGKVEQMEKDREIERALRIHGLDDEDGEWLQGFKLEDIPAKAKWQAERIARLSEPRDEGNGGGAGKGEAREPREPRKVKEYAAADKPADEAGKAARELSTTQKDWFK